MKGNKQYRLALELHKKMYFDDRNLLQDEQWELYNQYLKALRKAAYLGHKEAIYDLGQQYEDIGYIGIPNLNYSPQRCIYWYSKACNMGHPEACNNLSAFYEQGKGCKQDIQKAVELLKRSAELGSSLGKRNYKLIINQIKVSANKI